MRTPPEPPCLSGDYRPAKSANTAKSAPEVDGGNAPSVETLETLESEGLEPDQDGWADQEPPEGVFAPADGQDGDEERPHHNSWQRQPVDDILDGTYVPEVGSLLPREDGVCLLYRGRTHSIHAGSESGKSLIVQHEAARLLNAREAVAYIDFEADKASVVHRLLALGADPEAIRGHFDYRRPEVSPASGSAEQAAWLDLLSGEYALVVIDGVTEAMDVLAAKVTGDPNERIASFLRRYPTMIARRTGAAVVLIDHVTKSSEGRGRHAIGGQHKMNGLDGAAYTVEVKAQPVIGQIGVVNLWVVKDRPAGVRHHCPPAAPGQDPQVQLAAVVIIDSTGDRLRLRFTAPDEAANGSRGQFRPTHLMERVSRWLQDNPGEHSRSKISEAVTGNRTAKRTALDVLATEGFVEVVERPRGSRTDHFYSHKRLFTEDEDPTPSRPSPHRSPTLPGEGPLAPEPRPSRPSPPLTKGEGRRGGSVDNPADTANALHPPRGWCSRCHTTIGIRPGEPLCPNCQRDDHPTTEENTP